jgi:hypothetical protein
MAKLPRPGEGRPWTSFIAEAAPTARPGRPVRGLHEQGNPRHRLRVEHDDTTLLVHLADEDGAGWTTIAIDRNTRQIAASHGQRQLDAAREAYEGLYEA